MRHLPSFGYLLLLLLSSCASYQPAPVDLARDSAQWQGFSSRLCPPERPLTPEALRHIGLLLNPDLNKARLTCAASTVASRYAGLWEDPVLSLEGERVLKENFNNYSIGPSLSIPVTGIPHLSRRIAEQYREADYWDMRAKERDFLSQLDRLQYRIMTAHAQRKLTQKRLAVLEEEKSRIRQLQELGEVSFSDYQTASQRLSDTIKEAQERDNDHLSLHQELISLLGLHPSTSMPELASALPSSLPAAVPAPTAEELMQAPRLKSLAATYGAGEEELRREIRRQYPTLSLGPSLAREESEDKLGLGLELGLPLWNRNREAIARSEGDRAIKRHELLQQWHSLLQESDTLMKRQSLALLHCRTERERLTALMEAGKRQEELFAMGETSLPELANARHEIYQRQLNYLTCLETLLDIQIQLQYINPTYQP